MERVQQASVLPGRSLFPDEGYCGSQENNICLENSDDNLISYFNQ